LPEIGSEVFYSENNNTKYMGYKDQLNDWLNKHPNATAKEAIEAGYVICTMNWCQQKK